MSRCLATPFKAEGGRSTAALTPLPSNKGIKAEIATASDLPAMVVGDALRLRAALENIADNAVKVGERGDRHYSILAPKPVGRKRVQLVFTVADTRIAMTALREVKNLFHPFAQASEAIARRYGGAGLGLVFVKRIAEAMGGGLVVTSKKGRGTTFRLSVPVDQVDASSLSRA